MRSTYFLSLLILAFVAATSFQLVSAQSAGSPIALDGHLAHRSTGPLRHDAIHSARGHAHKKHHKHHRNKGLHKKRKSCKANTHYSVSDEDSGADVTTGNITVSDDGAGVKRGICWGTDDSWAHNLKGSKLSWYHHWQGGPVSGLDADGAEYVPMLWGPKYNGLWAQRKASFNSKLPKHIIAFNEPDVPSQSNMDPYSAASQWASQLGPWQKKGVRVSSPQIVYNVQWLETFMNQLKNKGYTPDFIALHWYGGPTQIDSFKSYVQKVHNKWPNLDIWITEMGTTAKAGGSQSDVLNFQREVISFAASTDYLKRLAWIGAFAKGSAYDNFMSQLNAFFVQGGQVANWAQYFLFGGSKNGRRDGDLLDEEDKVAAAVPVGDIPDERNTALRFDPNA